MFDLMKWLFKKPIDLSKPQDAELIIPRPKQKSGGYVVTNGTKVKTWNYVTFTRGGSKIYSIMDVYEKAKTDSEATGGKLYWKISNNIIN